MQTVSLGDNLHEMLKPVFWEKENYHEFVVFRICPVNG